MRNVARLVFVVLALSLPAALASSEIIPIADWPVDFSSPAAEASASKVTVVVDGSPANSVSRSERLQIVSDAIPQGPTNFVPLTPCRVADTRGFGFTGAYGPPVLAPGGSRDFNLVGQCGVPSGARAVSVNITVAEMGSAGNLKVFPAGEAPPTVSTLNWTGSTFVIANAAIVPLSTGGSITVVNESTTPTQLIVDVNGYFARNVIFIGSVPAAVSVEFFFSTSGGRIVLEIGGSGYRTIGPGLIGWDVSFDGGALSTAAQVYTNETVSHKAMVTYPRVFNAPAGLHTVALSRKAGTEIDSNDAMTFSVIEYP